MSLDSTLFSLFRVQVQNQWNGKGTCTGRNMVSLKPCRWSYSCNHSYNYSVKINHKSLLLGFGILFGVGGGCAVDHEFPSLGSICSSCRVLRSHLLYEGIIGWLGWMIRKEQFHLSCLFSPRLSPRGLGYDLRNLLCCYENCRGSKEMELHLGVPHV